MRSDRTVVLIGLGSTSATAFSALEERFRILALIRPGADEVVQMAWEAGVRVVSDVSVVSVTAVIEELKPDIVVVSSFNKVLPAKLLQARPFVNVHYAPLPRYRGRATVNWAILNNEAEAAISIHCLVEALDAGGILVQRSVPIHPRDTVTDLYLRLNALQRELLADAAERRLNGDMGDQQNEALASYCCGRLPSDGMINWSNSTASIDRLIRSLGGDFPSAFSFSGVRKIEIVRAEPVVNCRNYEGRVPGRVVEVNRRKGDVDVLTGDGVLRLQEVRLPGANSQAPAELIATTRMSLGLVLADLPALINALQDTAAENDLSTNQEPENKKVTLPVTRFLYDQVRRSS